MCVQVQNGSDLIILNVTTADAGVYQCTLFSSAGEESQNITVIVKGINAPYSYLSLHLYPSAPPPAQPPQRLWWSQRLSQPVWDVR